MLVERAGNEPVGRWTVDRTHRAALVRTTLLRPRPHPCPVDRAIASGTIPRLAPPLGPSDAAQALIPARGQLTSASRRADLDRSPRCVVSPPPPSWPPSARSASPRRRPRRFRQHREGRDHRRGDARRDEHVPLLRRRGLRRGDQVHRRSVTKVYSPNATWTKVKAAAAGREHRHLLRPRQRLAQPLHLRPEIHDEGRHGPQPTNGDGKLSDTSTSTTASRPWRPARAGPERDRPARQPLLRLGQLRARRHGPVA